jgi:hypothetical protein
MPQHLRVDALGHETQFNVVHQNTPRDIRLEFEGMLYEYALGFTRIYGVGGWKGSTEGVYVYRIASLSASQRLVLIEFLLDKTSMKDLYVVHPDGIAFGYCYENGVLTQYNADTVPQQVDEFHADGRWKRSSVTVDIKPPLHGARDTGWPHPGESLARAGRVREATLAEVRQRVTAYNDRLNALERTPTGDDYNTLLAYIGIK